MKNITNLEKCLYKDILYTILIILISIPIWLNFDINAYAKEANYYDNMDYVGFQILNKASNSLEHYNDETALMMCETSDILVYNDSNTLDNYSLVLKVSKENDVNLNKIKININYEIDYLNNYYLYEDETSYYYIIDTQDMVANSQKYIISIWNEEIITKTNFNYDFVLI